MNPTALEGVSRSNPGVAIVSPLRYSCFLWNNLARTQGRGGCLIDLIQDVCPLQLKACHDGQRLRYLACHRESAIAWPHLRIN